MDTLAHRELKTCPISLGGRILVPLDGSEQALRVLPLAEMLYQTTGKEIHILHVSPTAEPTDEEHLRQALHLSPNAVPQAHLEERSGDPVSIILQTAEEQGSCFIVLSTHGESGDLNQLLGHITQKVIENAHSAVIILGPQAKVPQRFQRILLPLEGTIESSLAVRPAAEIARLSANELQILHITSANQERSREPGAFQVPQYMDHPQHDWESWSDEFLHRFATLQQDPNESPVQLRMAMATGSVGAEVLRYAKQQEIDLIVMAWHGTLSGNRAQTLKALLTESPCPLCFIRIPDASEQPPQG